MIKWNRLVQLRQQSTGKQNTMSKTKNLKLIFVCSWFISPSLMLMMVIVTGQQLTASEVISGDLICFWLEGRYMPLPIHSTILSLEYIFVKIYLGSNSKISDIFHGHSLSIFLNSNDTFWAVCQPCLLAWLTSAIYEVSSNMLLATTNTAIL